jgi:HPt (histidine-containing phosphotransfer) domain-containing protein
MFCSSALVMEAPALLNQYCSSVEDALIKVNDERQYLRQDVARLETQLAILVGLLREDTAEQPQSD